MSFSPAADRTRRKERLNPIGKRVRRISDDTLGRIVMLRGLGFEVKDIADRLARRGVQVTPMAISYHLRRLKRLTLESEENQVFARVLIFSPTAISSLLYQMAESARRRSRG